MKGLALVLLLKLTFAVAKSEIEDLNGRECSVIYTIQPPPDLPCSPYVNISPGYSVILQCRVAVHKIFLSQKGGDVIKLQWHKKLTGSSSDLGSSEWIDSNNRQILQDDFVIYDAYLDLTNATMSKNYKYWCQVYGINSSDSFNYSTSTATVIREPAHYQYLPTCTQNEPLGWPVAKCALNGLDITLCECSSESKCRGLFGQLFFQKILGSRVLFYAPSAILIVLMLIIILVLIVVCIVCAFRCKRTSQKARKDIDFSCWTFPSQSTSNLRDLNSTEMQTEPELQNREPIRHDSFDDGVVVDHVYANSSQFLDGVLKVQSIYDDIVTKRKTTNDAVVFLNPSVGINEEFERASQPTKTTPNVVKYSTIHKNKPKTARVVNPLPTAKKPKKRARISATSSNPNITSNDPPFLDDPIYQSISDIEL